MAFEIQPRLRGYDDLFAQMVGAVPPGTFYDFARPIVMWRRTPISFILTTDNPSYPVRITRERLGDFDIGVDQGNQVDETLVVPQPGSLQTLFYLTLGRGRNRLTAQEILPNGVGRSQVLEVVATTNSVIFETFGREIFKSTDRADQQKAALFSRYSTRLLDQLSGVGDILPDLQTLKILSTKMLIRSFVHFPATRLGVRNEIEAVSLNTPVFQNQRASSVPQVETERIMRAIENLAGQEAHVWFPNLAVTRWLAFIRMANSFKNNFEIIDVRDDYVTIKYKGRTNVHHFDYDAFGQNFLTNLSLSDCFSNIDVTMGLTMRSRMQIPCWTYRFDSSITPETAIGLVRSSWDIGIPLDSNIPFDADPTDPWNDGFIGWSYSGRFEQGPAVYPLDDMVQPALGWVGQDPAYNGPYTQLLNSNRSDMQIDYLVTASGVMDDYVGGPIVGLRADFDNTNVGVEHNEIRTFTAGQNILLCVKFVDSNMMANISGAGIIRIIEPLTGVQEFAPVSAGFVYIYYAPTVATPSTVFNLLDITGGTLTGTSDPFEVLPDVFAGLTVTSIANQTVGVPFSVTVQAVDQFGNPVTDVGVDTLVHVLAHGGFDLADPDPSLLVLVDGQVTANLTMNFAGTGYLEFKLGTFSVNSTTFTVS